MKYFEQLYRRIGQIDNRFLVITIVFLMVLSINGCKKFIQVPTPVTSLSAENVYNSDASATAVLTGIYTSISLSGVTSGLSSSSVFCGLSGDEYTLYAPTSQTSYVGFYTNELNINNLSNGDFWSHIYPVIYIANAAIAGLSNNKNLTPAVDAQLLGEAKFVRAFCYFYLVNLYGDVPLVTGTDYKINELLSRTPKTQVYQQIIADLKGAENSLSDQYLDGSLLNSTADRLRPTKWAAAAMLARTYLYTGDYPDAEKYSSLVIQNTAQFNMVPLSSVFLMNNAEAIWQLQPVKANRNTPDGVFFILPASGPGRSHPVFLSNNLINSFEPGDQRFTNWVSSVTDLVGNTNVTYYFPYKYKVNAIGPHVTEYEVVLRLGEQYLIRAEAETNGAGDGINGAISDLNMIRTRAGLPNYSGANDKTSLLTAILHEKQVELFSEWGHRWLDLKRTATVDAVMGMVTPEKGGVWNSNQQLYPLPQTDLQNDPNLVQNPGY